MFKPLLTLAFIITGVGTAQAECSVATQKRWENAMTEIMQLERLSLRMTLEEEMTNMRYQCRVKDALVEISAAAKEYFPACDPHIADNAHVAVLKTENALSKFDASKCAKAQAAPTKRK